MPCDDIRDRLDHLWEGEETPEIRRHLAQCTACKQYYRDLRLVHAGFHLWKREAAPEPTLGFAERLVRQLGEISRTPSVADFFERVGRRFVYATLALTFLALLALALPSSGPVRGLSYADIYIPSQEASLANSDPMGEIALQESPDWMPGEVAAPAGANEVK
jgi:predicted anti-sigma-YlaC factor YlaD